MKTLITAADFGVARPSGWPDPFSSTPTNFWVQNGAGWCKTGPGNRTHLEDFRASLPNLVASVDSTAHFFLDGLPTLGEVTHGFVFEAGGSSYFTELVHRPGGQLTLQAGQVMTPFPLHSSDGMVKTMVPGGSKKAPWVDSSGVWYGVRNRVDIDQAAGTLRWRTKLWLPDVNSEPFGWFQDTGPHSFPDLAQPGDFCIQFDQAAVEDTSSFTHGCRALSVYSVA